MILEPQTLLNSFKKSQAVLRPLISKRVGSAMINPTSQKNIEMLFPAIKKY